MNLLIGLHDAEERKQHCVQNELQKGRPTHSCVSLDKHGMWILVKVFFCHKLVFWHEMHPEPQEHKKPLSVPWNASPTMEWRVTLFTLNKCTFTKLFGDAFSRTKFDCMTICVVCSEMHLMPRPNALLCLLGGNLCKLWVLSDAWSFMTRIDQNVHTNSTHIKTTSYCIFQFQRQRPRAAVSIHVCQEETRNCCATGLHREKFGLDGWVHRVRN